MLWVSWILVVLWFVGAVFEGVWGVGVGVICVVSV